MLFDDSVAGKVFGNWSAPATDNDIPIETPVGETCMHCQGPIEEGDNGRIQPNGFVVHRECSLRGVLGGIGHLVDHNRYCHGELGPDAGFTFRQSALMAWDYFQETGLAPTLAQRDTWRMRVEEAR